MELYIVITIALPVIILMILSHVDKCEEISVNRKNVTVLAVFFFVATILVYKYKSYNIWIISVYYMILFITDLRSLNVYSIIDYPGTVLIIIYLCVSGFLDGYNLLFIILYFMLIVVAYKMKGFGKGDICILFISNLLISYYKGYCGIEILKNGLCFMLCSCIIFFLLHIKQFFQRNRREMKAYIPSICLGLVLFLI